MSGFVPIRRRSTAPAAILIAGFLTVGCGIGGSNDTSRAAVHRVEVTECAGFDTQRATAAAVGDGLLVTVAHTFENAAEILVRSPDGSTSEAELVAIDTGRDIALLRADIDPGSVLALDAPVDGSAVAITTYADAEGIEVKSGEITDLVTATLDGRGRRAAVKLRADIVPGDSGAPVLDGRDRMVAMVFATSRSGQVGWAVSSSEVEEMIDGSAPFPEEGLESQCFVGP